MLILTIPPRDCKSITNMLDIEQTLVRLPSGEDAKYNVSPLEKIFSDSLRENLGLQLRPAWLHSGNELVRRTESRVLGHCLLAFQYTRLDPIDSNDFCVLAILGEDIKSDSESVLSSAIKKKVSERDGKYDSLRAMNEPTYFSDKDVFGRWPEVFQFAVTDMRTIDDPFPIDYPIYREEVIDPLKADFHGVLFFPAVIRGWEYAPLNNGPQRILIRPRSISRIVQATEMLGIKHGQLEEQYLKLQLGDWNLTENVRRLVNFAEKLAMS